MTPLVPEIYPFDRAKHVYHSEALTEIIKDAIRFFNGTPVQPLPPTENFVGAGVYALYFIGKSRMYAPLAKLNRISYAQPIYAGKAVPCGWRQGRQMEASNELYMRLTDHFHSIEAATNLKPCDFRCRFMILEGAAVDLISAVEASLIRQYTPLWNSTIDGFGNHTPGAGRFQQAKSDWDVLHPGREWAERCTGVANALSTVKANVKKHLEGCDDLH